MQTLAAQGLGEKISLGGALGLLHYLDYRPTHDVDAWWAASATSEDQRQVIRVIETTLESFGQIKTRAWGDVVSVELLCEGKAIFSFQIARRSVQLEPPALAPWTAVLLDSFPDLLASKMVALVERGAPRDFRDIYALCQAGLTTPRECWDLWRRCQQLAGSDTDGARARLAVETHLARIAQHRPLAQISDPRQRAEAEQVRHWFTEEFLHVLL
ncbi:MAG: nucleotidyl transferase AbiEii/AbiGii toxin family protein [Anaerolineae bacterium]